jgi:hypothetical protein
MLGPEVKRMNHTVKRGLCIGAAWAVLAANLACGFAPSEEETPPPAPAAPAAPAPAAPAPAPAATPTPTPAAEAAPTPPPTAPTAAPAAAGAPVQLSTGFLPDPQTASGQAGGPMQATALTQNAVGCTGYVPAAAQHTLVLQTAFQNLRIMVHAADETDTTLIVRGPDGTHYCNDDSESGFDPVVSGSFQPGSYQIWVGTYAEGVNAAYTIGFTEYAHLTPDSLGGGGAAEGADVEDE